MKKLFVFAIFLFWISLSVSQAKTETSPLVTFSEGFHLKKSNTARKVAAEETKKNVLAEVICDLGIEVANGYLIEVRVYCDSNTGGLHKNRCYDN